ncbi:ABC-F family ATP-binding cassette domain-containing protein [Nocardioides sp. ChNu-153]|uniref:ABC-F family ATP-binding cassette domain-containing protein n=1 Tax=unclassified Nocardioides TaxID=2615069 RepID=UPI00240739A8|nr:MULTISPECIES: ATP-binding cassette domain-containing protein [unclassified Nocardioides]MDF9716203.1 ATP-binding cassette domain-containing protein [Nocardioides sp. ChNu-99]MDN7121593.1 ABC-F family ATP-binding cassette domain-containing protein [Nocardioides sp. ChNu-153]
MPAHSSSSSAADLAGLPDLADLTAPLAPVVAHGVVRSYPGRAGGPVLDGVDVVAAPGTRLGLIGENGSGKSTLLRVLAGLDRPDAGTVRVPADVVHLAQEPDPRAGSGAGTVGDLLDDALRPLHAAVRLLERLAADLGADLPAGTADEVGAAYDAVLAWATHHDAWDAERRVELTAATLGVADLDRARPVATLSGGQRTRLTLAAALVRRPACLLLDEPTNHLDAEALELLETSLVALPGVVVAASHDRTFLDRVCTDLLDLDAGVLGTDGRGGQRFGGGFGDYLAHQAAVRRRWEETWQRQQDEIADLRARTRVDLGSIAPGRGPTDNDKFIHAFKGAKVERTRARRVHDAERRLEVAEREALPKPPRPLRFAVPLTGGAPDGGAGAGTPGSGAAVAVRDLRVDGEEPGRPRLVLDRLDVVAGEHLLVTGPNGSGKTTLLDVLAGRLTPDAGRVDVQARRVRLVAQDPDVGAPERTTRAAYRDLVGAATAERVPLRSLGLLHPRDLGTPVGALSVGQRRRLTLAVAVAAAPDLLLLDEPTNHLSLRLAGELEEAVGVAPGTVVVTSHDRWLRARWSGRQVALAAPYPATGAGR